MFDQLKRILSKVKADHADPRYELIGMMQKGVIVGGAMGAHSGNILNGEYSIGLAPGSYVENGVIAGRVKDAMVAGNVYETMQNVVAIEDMVCFFVSGSVPSGSV